MIIPGDQFLEALNHSWAVLPQKLANLTDSARQEYLNRQGYPGGPNGLLGHILSWWEDGIQEVERMRREPAFANPDYDVDAFNARSVARFGSLSTAEVGEWYETMRTRMVQLVKDLSDSEILDERINNRLRYEIVVHLEEHPLPTL